MNATVTASSVIAATMPSYATTNATAAPNTVNCSCRKLPDLSVFSSEDDYSPCIRGLCFKCRRTLFVLREFWPFEETVIITCIPTSDKSMSVCFKSPLTVTLHRFNLNIAYQCYLINFHKIDRMFKFKLDGAKLIHRSADPFVLAFDKYRILNEHTDGLSHRRSMKLCNVKLTRCVDVVTKDSPPIAKAAVQTVEHFPLSYLDLYLLMRYSLDMFVYLTYSWRD